MRGEFGACPYTLGPVESGGQESQAGDMGEGQRERRRGGVPGGEPLIQELVALGVGGPGLLAGTTGCIAEVDHVGRGGGSYGASQALTDRQVGGRSRVGKVSSQRRSERSSGTSGVCVGDHPDAGPALEHDLAVAIVVKRRGSARRARLFVHRRLHA